MRPPRTTPTISQRAKELRKEPTPAEARLWAYLRKRQIGGVRFRRQHAVGPYIADFCCISRKLIIELDGSQHLEQTEYDAQRTAYLAALGYRVLRFWNNEVIKDIESVWIAIDQALQQPVPTLPSRIKTAKESDRTETAVQTVQLQGCGAKFVGDNGIEENKP